MEKEMFTVNINRVRLSVVKGDITQQETEAVVNAANPSLMGGGGVDGAIHLAGGPIILEECKQIVAQKGNLPVGEAVITTGGKLKAKYVIHTVGPVWYGGNRNEGQLLYSAYHKSIKIASTNNLKSISFPSISTGAYGYPVDKAADVALETIIEFLRNEPGSLEEVILTLFDDVTFAVYKSALSKVIDKLSS
jgi:O-acetyl-ADP-ribose deacetylase (regulator of RNase III)